MPWKKRYYKVLYLTKDIKIWFSTHSPQMLELYVNSYKRDFQTSPWIRAMLLFENKTVFPLKFFYGLIFRSSKSRCQSQWQSSITFENQVLYLQTCRRGFYFFFKVRMLKTFLPLLPNPNWIIFNLLKDSVKSKDFFKRYVKGKKRSDRLLATNLHMFL